MEKLIDFFTVIASCAIFTWIGFKIGKEPNKSPDIPERLTLPDTVRLWDVDWEYANDMVVHRVNVYGYVYINSEEIKAIIKTFSDDDMDYNIRCAEELIDKIYERI